MSTTRHLHRYRRPVLAGAVLMASIAGPVLAAGPAEAAPAIPTHTMQIDGTNLSTGLINISNPDGTVTTDVSTGAVQTLTLEEGTYSFTAGGSSFDCTPTVTGAGIWSIPSDCGSAASGNGTSTLVMSGLPVTIDATSLSEGFLPWLADAPLVHAGTSATLNLMPQPTITSYVGSDQGGCVLNLAVSGSVTTSGCGAAATASGSTLTLKGFPVSIDARQLSTTGYVLTNTFDLDGQWTSSSTVNQYRLLPSTYQFQIGSGIVADMHWTVGLHGQIGYSKTDAAFLAGAGSSTLQVNGLATTINATGLGAGQFNLGPDIPSPAFDQSTVQVLHLVPSYYAFQTTASQPSTFYWDVTPSGKVAFISGYAHSCAYVAGSSLTVDCTPPTFTQVSGSPSTATEGQTFTVTGQECDRVADVNATGTLTFVDVTTGTTLGVIALSPSTKYVNCGQAQVVDSENLSPGTYKIRASYQPGGSVPVPTSRPVTYSEQVVAN